MRKLEERIREKLDEPTKRVEVFESRNWVQYINQNMMSVVRFYTGSLDPGLCKNKFTSLESL